jgi:hypothetical protein
MWISTCVCGHEEEEHQGGYGECTVEGCLCAGYEPEGEIADDWLDEDEAAGEGEDTSRTTGAYAPIQEQS